MKHLLFCKLVIPFALWFEDNIYVETQRWVRHKLKQPRAADWMLCHGFTLITYWLIKHTRCRKCRAEIDKARKLLFEVEDNR